MKYLKVLQALSSIQAYRSNLKVYAQIGISERGKVRTLVNVGVNRAVIGKAEWYNLLYLTESGATVPKKQQ